MTDEQKQHYWATFYNNAREHAEQNIRLVAELQSKGVTASSTGVTLEECAEAADRGLSFMLARWPDKASTGA